MKQLVALRSVDLYASGMVLVDPFRDVDTQWRVLSAMPRGHPLRDHLGNFRQRGWVK